MCSTLSLVETLSSPKQPQPERQKDWYPYYAGYTTAFAAGVFEAYLSGAESVLDPWNGSGTTTAVASTTVNTCSCLGSCGCCRYYTLVKVMNLGCVSIADATNVDDPDAIDSPASTLILLVS